MKQRNFGLIGLGVMGQNLALNIADKGFPVVVWNRNGERTRAFLAENARDDVQGTDSLEEFVAALEVPRRVLLMVQAGGAVDAVLETLAPLLAEGDVVVDGGNTWFEDTERRESTMRARGLRFFGMGVSGGEEGARHGPSLMPGGDREAYAELEPVLQAIAATTESGPCVTYVGPGGAGHFVKMVHNGIEYADMQLIAEVYDIGRRALGLDASALSAVFLRWNTGPLESFLIEITGTILAKRDEATGRPLVDLVLDRAGQKGTGRWTVQAALEAGVPIPSIAAALDARVLSSMKAARVEAASVLTFESPPKEAAQAWTDVLHDGLHAAKICAYAQGLQLIATVGRERGWAIDLREIARIWKAGCIIRARFLDRIMTAFGAGSRLDNLMLAPDFALELDRELPALRRSVELAQRHGIPVPALGASLAYFDAYRTEHLPQNLTQAQRDAFGAHTYQRVDDPDGEAHHTDWL